MGLKHLGFIDLPDHSGQGGFDHAATDRGRALLYVAHAANDAVDVIDTRSGTYLRSVTGLKGVAGVLVDEPANQVFTSNRGENTVGIFSSDPADPVVKVPVGVRPNGLAYDPDRGILICANVGDPNAAAAPGVTLVDVARRAPLAAVPMPGRTRWCVHDPERHVFFVNIAEPPAIVVVDPELPEFIGGHLPIAARGPHGLDLDGPRSRLYCACDEGRVLALDARSGRMLGSLELSGPPDVVFLDHALSHLYIAVGDPGTIDVIDVAAWSRLESVPTEPGAHTIAFDGDAHRVYAFLPRTHRASVFLDSA
jgi:DNA-binding beta-propeller fold protein YncE